jgi:hypothetical protein
MPTLENWKWTAGNTVTGNVYGKPGTPDGTQMMTSAVPPEGRLGTHVVRVLPRVLSPPPPLLLRLAAARVAACSRGSACERAADVRGRIVQVTESGSSYLLGKPEQVSGSPGGLNTAEQGLTTGEALTLLEKEAGIDCSCQSYLLHIKPFMIANAMGLLLQRLLAINALLLPPFVIFWLPTIILWIINLYWVSEHGSPLPAHLVSRMKLISTHSLKPWRSPVGFFVMHICYLFLAATLIGHLLLWPCGCCGTPYQSWLDTQFSVMWVRSADYSKFMAVNEKRIRRVDKYDD